jgi:hypothetical protein
MSKAPTYDTGFFDDGRQYFAHGLPAWKDYVLNVLQATSLADFGCGQGDWLEPVQGTIPVWGCDYGADEANLRIDKANFQKVDFTKMGPSNLTLGQADVVMSLEVMEHLEYVHEANFLDCMLSSDPRLVVFGVASGHGIYDPTQFKENRLGEKIPGGPNWNLQWGRHHVNCQPVTEVVRKMATRGYVVDQGLTDVFVTLRVPGKTGRPKLAFASFYRKNTRVYRKV